LAGIDNAAIARAVMQGRLSTDAIAELTHKSDLGVAFLYSSWFDPKPYPHLQGIDYIGGPLPSNWIELGKWVLLRKPVSVSRDAVAIYAVRPEDAPKLRAALDTFASQLPPDVRYVRSRAN